MENKTKPLDADPHSAAPEKAREQPEELTKEDLRNVIGGHGAAQGPSRESIKTTPR